jgi:hypothetical protein
MKYALSLSAVLLLAMSQAQPSLAKRRQSLSTGGCREGGADCVP